MRARVNAVATSPSASTCTRKSVLQSLDRVVAWPSLDGCAVGSSGAEAHPFQSPGREEWQD